MSAFWITALGTGASAVTIATWLGGGVKKTARCARDTVRFWLHLKRRNETLEKRVQELEAPSKPRTWDQQHCPYCHKRGEKFTQTKRSDEIGFGGRHFCWYRCLDCKDQWKVWID